MKQSMHTRKLCIFYIYYINFSLVIRMTQREKAEWEKAEEDRKKQQ